MRIRFLGIVTGACLALSVQAQSDPTHYSDFPIILSVQFHAFTLPFRDVKANFSNVGFGVGTEVSLGGSNYWVQQINAIWYHNKALGNGLMLYTQTTWRPGIGSEGFGEVKAGLGYLHSFRPVASLKQVNGNWVSAGHKGKGMLTLPVGISIGYNSVSNNGMVSPFLTYQFMPVLGYNQSIPVVPETLIQPGVRIHQR